MHHIEGAASGLPVIYHSEGGGIVEGCKNHGLSFTAIDELSEKIEVVVKNYHELVSKIDHHFLSSKRCIASYLELVNSMG